MGRSVNMNRRLRRLPQTVKNIICVHRRNLRLTLNLPTKISILFFMLFVILVGCTPTPTPPAATEPVSKLSLTEDEIATLNSLERLDDYPLYTLHYQGDYAFPVISKTGLDRNEGATLWPSWGCALFAALGDPDHPLYGRNFDWNFSPALLLFSDPPDGYASVAMVDMEYLGFTKEQVLHLEDLAIEDRRPLLEAPTLPFDGMNDQGLAIGMAAVPSGDMQPDPKKKTLGELGVMRQVLDHAASVEEAIEILGSYNIDMGTVPLHYLVASVSGESALVEFYEGDMHVFRNEDPWQLATNFLVAGTEGQPLGQCPRYDHISQRLETLEGNLGAREALKILSEVAQGASGSETSTQWSVVYDVSTGEIHIVIGRMYAEEAHTSQLPMK